MNARLATSDDIPAISSIFYESFNDLHAKHHMDPEDPTQDSWIRGAMKHFLATDPGNQWIAEDEDGEAAGFVSALRREDFWFLAFLFVLPQAQTGGLGRELLERVLPPKEERPALEIATMIESFQPVSAGLYASLGMSPRMPTYKVNGVRPSQLPELPAGVRAEPLTPEHLEAIEALDRRLLGYARPQDHRMWLGEAAVSGFVFVDSHDVDTPAGYGYVDDEGIGPAAGRDETMLTAILRSLLETREKPEACEIRVPGSSGAAFQALLHAGGRMPPDHYPFIYCSTDEGRPASGYLPYAGYLP